MASSRHRRDYVAIARRYAQAAVRDTKGRKHCKLVRDAAARFLGDMNRARRKKPPFTFNRQHASDACDFIEKLPHVEGRWTTPTLHLEPWQVFIVVNLFGFRRVDADGTDLGRRFSTVYIEVARKNGKSAFAAAIMLYCAVCEGEVGPQIKTAATTGDQARIVWGVMKKMCDATPDLREAFGIETWANSISIAANMGDIKPINSKSSTQDGLNPHALCMDEFHAHKDRGLWDVLRTAQGARTNPMALIITTAGRNIEGPCYEQRQLAVKVLEGIIEADHYFGVIYTLDDGDDPLDPAVWIKANPNLKVSKQLRYMHDRALEAANSNESQAEFVTKDLNRWLTSATTWLKHDEWIACADTGLTLDDFEGEDCWIGADMSERDDMTAVVLVFRRDGALVWFPQFWLPRDVINRRVREMALDFYRVWSDAGLVTPTEGDWIDSESIENHIRKACERFNVRAVVFDRYGTGPDIVTRLERDGLPAGILNYTAANIGSAALDLEARVRSSGRFAHPGNPCLTWHASNAVVERRVDGSILPKKESAMSKQKIDGIAAGLMAMSQMPLAKDSAPKIIEYTRGDIFDAA
ncbi:MAG: terminase large subunit [Minwuia sp.]|nr:terminase large subunit [Minwuia sp.]